MRATRPEPAPYPADGVGAVRRLAEYPRRHRASRASPGSTARTSRSPARCGRGHVLQVTNGKASSPGPGGGAARCSRRPSFGAASAWRRPSSAGRAAGELAATGSRTSLRRRRADPPGTGVAIAWRDAVTSRRTAGARPRRCRARRSGGRARARRDAAALDLQWHGGPPTGVRALLHALLKAIERDALARAFPGGSRSETVAARRFPTRTVARTAPRLRRSWTRLDARGFDVHLLDARVRDVGARPSRCPALRPAAGPVPAPPQGTPAVWTLPGRPARRLARGGPVARHRHPRRERGRLACAAARSPAAARGLRPGPEASPGGRLGGEVAARLGGDDPPASPRSRLRWHTSGQRSPRLCRARWARAWACTSPR